MINVKIDEFSFNVPLDTKQAISEMIFPADLLASTKKRRQN